MIDNVINPTSKYKDGNGLVLRVEQKPIDLIQEIMDRYSKRNDLVVDLFIGTGTTAIAALNLCRNFMGCDNDKVIMKLASERILETVKSLKQKSNFIILFYFIKFNKRLDFTTFHKKFKYFKNIFN